MRQSAKKCHSKQLDIIIKPAIMVIENGDVDMEEVGKHMHMILFCINMDRQGWHEQFPKVMNGKNSSKDKSATNGENVMLQQEAISTSHWLT